MGAGSVRLPLAVLLLLAVAVLFVSEGAEAIDPEWSYTTASTVQSVAISADGEYIAAGGNDGTIRFFDKGSNMPLWSYSTEENVRSVAISAGGEYLTVGVNDGVIYLFERDSSTPLWSYTAGHNVISVAISADGENIAAGSRDDNVYFFDKNIPPTATIDSITPSPANNSVQVNFSSSGADSDGTVIAYLWTSSIDGELSRYASFSISNLSAGNHTISFRVQDNNGTWSDWDTAFLVIINAPPTASIDSINPSPSRFDEEVTFNGSGTDSDGTVVAYQWVSDLDGNLSTDVVFSATDLATGTHQISFRVRDNDGAWSSWHTAELDIYPNAPPSDTIDSIEPSQAEAGTTVFFDGTGSDSDGTVVAYLWASSIDGELSTEEDFSSNDLSFGNHIITFRVQDNDGDWSDAASESQFVFAYPVAIAGQDSTGTPGVPLQFSGAGTDEDGTIAKYEWDFDGDGVFEWSSTENGLNTYIYNNEDTYTATLRVTDNDGFTDTDTVEITISEKKIQIDDEGNVTVTDAGEDEEGIPAPSLAAAVAAVAVIALRRPRKP